MADEIPTSEKKHNDVMFYVHYLPCQFFATLQLMSPFSWDGVLPHIPAKKGGN